MWSLENGLLFPDKKIFKNIFTICWIVFLTLIITKTCCVNVHSSWMFFFFMIFSFVSTLIRNNLYFLYLLWEPSVYCTTASLRPKIIQKITAIRIFKTSNFGYMKMLMLFCTSGGKKIPNWFVIGMKTIRCCGYSYV